MSTTNVFGEESEALIRLFVEAHNVRAERGEIWINGSIDDRAIELAVMRAITQYQSERYSRILCFINSGGGFVDPGFAVVDLFQLAPVPVWTVNIGDASSMALTIFLAGKKRFAFPHSTFMAHSIGFRAPHDKLPEHAAYVSEVTRKQEQMADFYASRTKKSAKWWASKLREPNFYFGPEEALSLGVIHEIVSSPKDLKAIFADVCVEG
jgi:ATP-dependent Clp protease, protease subunit